MNQVNRRLCIALTSLLADEQNSLAKSMDDVPSDVETGAQQVWVEIRQELTIRAHSKHYSN